VLNLIGSLISVMVRFVDWMSGRQSERRQLLKQVTDAEQNVYVAQQHAAAGLPDGLTRLRDARSKLEALRRQAGLLSLVVIGLLLTGCWRTIPPPPLDPECERAVITPLLLPHVAHLIPGVAAGDVVLSASCYTKFVQTEADFIRLLAQRTRQ
jgi:hypothetical protein